MILDRHRFRVTRDADIENEEEARSAESDSRRIASAPTVRLLRLGERCRTMIEYLSESQGLKGLISTRLMGQVIQELMPLYDWDRPI